MNKSLRSSVLALAVVLVGAHAAFAQSQSWDKQLPTAKRFIVLDAFQNDAVIDKETGLVWERMPDRNGDGLVMEADRMSWFSALSACRHSTTGNRRGWRLPSLQELSSLTDPTASYPALPAGHPFLFSGGTFWSANTYWGDPALALIVGMAGGGSGEGYKSSSSFNVLCVRGGSGIDPQ